MTDDPTPVIDALQNAPGFEGVTASEVTLTRQGGLTNLVYLVEGRDQRVIVRIPGAGTEAYIDRAVEVHNARAAHAAGVAPEVLWADAGSGVMITRAIEGITTMTPEGFGSRKGSAARAGAALAKLHGSGETFQFRFELFAMIDDYLKVLSTKDVTLPEGYHDIVAAAQPVKTLLAETEVPLAPCHCDPLCENFLDDGDTMWIVDWEYSGMNDPLWDVGDLSVEAGMDAAQDAELMRAYFGRAPTEAETGRMVIYKAMCDLLWTLWGLIQHADGNTAEDFWAYATGRFDRCKALMNSPEWDAHLQALRR
ncbi:choline/ethanolamine kinase family protein [Flavimaricola marinus]|uniref:Phosphotransferase enzyme family protein n=1 Tax=Flavimaricola marinus TaxID=1819565 RepID=A0A238LD61_9RHOB|nr:phosphotransferase family protein [Flavimaricola marinus]SMY07522.1 Phosphotransferase enzyme family protein [Flavimaricola marinus]